MEHSNYHLYETVIQTRDLLILAVVLLVSVVFMYMVALEKWQRVFRLAQWLMIGGYHATLLAAFIIL